MRLALAVLVLLCTVCAQEPPKAEPAKTEPEQAPALHYSGKPLVLPFQCTDDDMQWAGMSCSEEQPCPVYLELSGLDTVGNRIIVLGNIHTESVTLYSVLLASEDGGANWQEPYERMRGTGLDHIQFVDFQNGWISGETQVPVSRDPFFLITSDGGKSWRMRAVFGEGGGGAIKEFRFQSAANGAMVIDRMETADADRYELYESPNGGETWMIRRTSEKPITIRSPATDAGAEGWRIRADARSKSFAIENRVGERWRMAASFSVAIGSCKPAPQAVPPEPTENPAPAAPAPVKPPSLKKKLKESVDKRGQATPSARLEAQ
ncbi:MAG TPA: sialidase family protein [Bryobacteraceae bacterium]|nr:sialidase family protein [Bryobacteraceae bacterium]